MTQRSIQDMVPPSRRSAPKPRPAHEDSEMPPAPPRRRAPLRSSNSSRWPLIIGAILVFLALAGVTLASTVFRGATITITPKQKTVQIATTITAASQPTGDQVPFEAIAAEDTAAQKVPATGEQNVQERASGTIVVYNKGTKDQRLIKNTRFSTPDGKIFRVQNSIVIPKAASGTPGSLEITVYADQPGDTYNVGLSDFTVPGLKGTAQYNEIYGRSKTAMQGGFIGMKKVVDPAARDAAVSALKQSLMQSAYQKLAANVPEGFILFDDARAVVFDTVPDQVDGNDVTVGVHATAHGIILPVGKIAATLAAQSTADYRGEDITVSDPKELTGGLVGSSTEPWNLSELAFSISGNPHLVWVVDEARIKADFAGKPKSSMESILAQYPSIDRAEASIYPVWSSSFPAEQDRVTVKQVISQ